MAETVQAAVRELLEQTIATMAALLEASNRELAMPSSHSVFMPDAIAARSISSRPAFETESCSSSSDISMSW
jgi:hypothetical protein